MRGGGGGGDPQRLERLGLWRRSCCLCGGGLVANPCLTPATPWIVAHQAAVSMGSPRPEHWSGLPFPSSGDLFNSRVEPGSLALQEISCIAGGFFTLSHQGHGAKWSKERKLAFVECADSFMPVLLLNSCFNTSLSCLCQSLSCV